MSDSDTHPTEEERAKIEAISERVEAFSARLDDMGAPTIEEIRSNEGSPGAVGAGELTANTKRVATAQGVPTDWDALRGIDLPPDLADMQLSNRVLATAINYAQRWDDDHPERVSHLTLNRIRDSGGEAPAGGTSLTEFDAAKAGDRDRSHGSAAGPSKRAVKNMIDRTGSRRSRKGDTAQTAAMGVSLNDYGAGADRDEE